MSEPKQELKHILRVANADLDGNKQIYRALTKIKGVGASLANTVCIIAKIEKTKLTGYLSDQETQRLTEILQNPKKFNIPPWMLNRRHDYEDGTDKHLLAGDLIFTLDNDIKRLKKIKSYRGLRLQWGLPVRGQRTKSNFRKKKGKGLGVIKKKAKKGRT